MDIRVSTGRTLVVAGTADDIPTLAALLAAEGLPGPGSPDHYSRAYAQFGMDDALELRARAGLRAFGGGSRVFIIAAPVITNEAQNALLKTLEEPPADAVFAIVTPLPHTLLPTVRSRAVMFALPERVSTGTEAAAFLAASPSERLDMIQAFLPKKSGDEAGERDIAGALAFLAALERAIAASALSPEDKAQAADAIYRAKRFLPDKGSMMKMLLEQVALLVPALSRE